MADLAKYVVKLEAETAKYVRQLDPAHRQALPPAERPENPFDEF